MSKPHLARSTYTDAKIGSHTTHTRTQNLQPRLTQTRLKKFSIHSRKPHINFYFFSKISQKVKLQFPLIIWNKKYT